MTDGYRLGVSLRRLSGDQWAGSLARSRKLSHAHAERA